jgi:Spy/CpxP family protein refolding chaperone
MNLRFIHFRYFVAAAGAALMISLFAHAEPGTGALPDHCVGPMKAGEGHPHGDFGEHAPGPGPWGMPPMMEPFILDIPPLPFLHELNLTEAQQDKIFSILHNSAPTLREQGKLAKKSADAIRDLTDSANFDEGKLKSLAENHARAIAEIELIHARVMHQILVLLTPEQRKQVEAMKARFDGHRPMREQIRDIGARPDSDDGAIAQ